MRAVNVLTGDVSIRKMGRLVILMLHALRVMPVPPPLPLLSILDEHLSAFQERRHDIQILCGPGRGVGCSGEEAGVRYGINIWGR